jgi:hypothetical protein
MAWGVQSLQAVWFTTGQPITIPTNDLYQAIAGAPAAATQTLPIGNISMAMGNAGTLAFAFRLQVAPARVDYFLVPPPPQSSSATAQLNFPPNIDAVVDEFVQQLHRGSPLIGDAIRVALVTNIAEQTSDTEDAIATISAQTGLTIPFNDGSDLVLQINRRLKSNSVPGTEINRIIKWSAEEVQTIGVIAGSAPAFARAVLATITTDLNIIPTNRPYPPAEQIAIFDEMAIETKRLSAAKTLGALQ